MAYDPLKEVPCPVCHTLVKAGNLGGHVRREHPTSQVLCPECGKFHPARGFYAYLGHHHRQFPYPQPD